MDVTTAADRRAGVIGAALVRKAAEDPGATIGITGEDAARVRPIVAEGRADLAGRGTTATSGDRSRNRSTSGRLPR